MASFFNLVHSLRERALEEEVQRLNLEKKKLKRQATFSVEKSNLAEQRKLEKEALEAQVTSLRTEINSLQARVIDMDHQLGEVVNLRQEVSGLQSSLQKAKDQASLLQGQLDHLTMDHQGCSATKKVLEDELGVLKQQKREVETALQNARDNHVAEVKALQDDHLAEVKVLQEDHLAEVKVLQEDLHKERTALQAKKVEAAVKEVTAFEASILFFRRIMWSLDPGFNWEKVKAKYDEKVQL